MICLFYECCAFFYEVCDFSWIVQSDAIWGRLCEIAALRNTRRPVKQVHWIILKCLYSKRLVKQVIWNLVLFQGLSLSFELPVALFSTHAQTCYFVGEFYQQQVILPIVSIENQAYMYSAAVTRVTGYGP